jgi:hypothetical protein
MLSVECSLIFSFPFPLPSSVPEKLRVVTLLLRFFHFGILGAEQFTLMNDSINLSSMAADSNAAMKSLARDVKQLRQLLEVRALKDNTREVTVDPADLPAIEASEFTC